MLKPFEIQHSRDLFSEKKEPTFGQSLVAEINTYTLPVTDFAIEQTRFGFDDVDPEFDFAAEMKANPDLNDFAYDLAHAKNKQHFEFLAGSLKRNAARREVLYNTSFLTSIGTAFLNPLNYLFAYPAIGVISKAVQGKARIRAAAYASAKQGFAAGASLEALRYPFDPLETKEEAVLNVAAATAFGGAFGAAIPSGVHFVKHTMPDAARRISPYLARTERNAERFEEEVLDDVINMSPTADEPEQLAKIMFTDDLDAPLVQRKQTTKKTVIETVVVYDKNGKPSRANVIDKDGDGISYEVNGRVYNSQSEDSPFFLTDPIDPNTTPSPLVLDTGVTPMIGDLTDFEVDQALTYLKDEFDTLEGEAAELIDRQISALERKKGLRKEFDQPESVTVTEKSDEIIVNIDKARDEYETKKFMFAEVEGAAGLARNDFRTFEEYRDFLVYKERRKSNETKLPDETDAQFEDRLNALALADRADGWSIKKTAFTDLHLFKSPAMRVLNDDDMPQGVKRLMALLTGNNKIALERNTGGFGTNAVDQQAVRGSVRYRQTLERLQDIWVKEVKGKDEAFRSRVFGFSEADWMLAKTSFKDWVEKSVDVYLQNIPATSDSQLRFNKEVKGLLDDFLDMSQDDGMLLGIENFDVEIARLKQEIQFKEGRISMLREDPNKAAQLDLAKAELNELIEGPDGLKAMEDARASAGGKSNYRWPRYFDVLKLRKSQKGDKVYFNEFRQLLIDEYRRMPPKQRYNPKTQKMETYVSDPVKDADKTLSNIIRDENDPSAYIGENHKDKHLRQRVLNIPDSKLSKFLVKDVTVLAAYADKMGFRMAWKRNFGDKGLRQTLNDIETIIKDDADLKAKYPKEAQYNKVVSDLIAKGQKAFYGDYLRATGTHIQNPHRLDNQVAKVFSDYAGIVHLAGSGITAYQDLINMVGARSLKDMVAGLQDLGKMVDNVQDLEGFTEVLSMAPNMIKEQMMADAKTGLQPTLAEKITHLPSKVMFNLPVIGNDLHAITSLTRRIAASYNISDIIKIAYKIADPEQTATDIEVQQAGTMGIDKRVADFIWRQRDVIQKGKSIYYANTKKWEINTPEDRDAFDNFLTAIDIATDGQIIMAKSFDKPLIVDGVTFVRFHPIMRMFGMEPDPNISNNGRQYARVQSGILKFPFQFFNYSFGAANSVLGRAFDPAHERRLQHIALSVAAGYLLLKVTKPDWWFEDKDATEIAMRSVDRSGVMSIYGDLMYDAIHMATATGAVDPDDMPVRGKFRTATKDIFGPFGPAPNLAYDLVTSANEYLEDDTSSNARALSRSLPRFVMPWVTLDFAGFHKTFLND